MPKLIYNKDLWVYSADSKKILREKLWGGKCPILKISNCRIVLDHDHNSGRVRNAISQQANTWEGYVLKYWLKYCSKYSEISLPEALRNLADYLEKDYTCMPLHDGLVADTKRKLTRLRKEALEAKLLADFGVIMTATKVELVNKYLQLFIESKEI